jgi:8-oxo-dGTP pyrophosphatase MutT (NUDIX family)
MLNGSILLLRCAFPDGTAIWMLPGGGREDETEEACVVREVREETSLDVKVERLLFDHAPEPPDGTYERWRTFLCTVIAGEAAPGGGEGSDATLIGVTWLSIDDETKWSAEIRADVFLYPQLLAIRTAVSDRG